MIRPKQLWVYTPCGVGHVRQQFFDEEVIAINWGVGDLERFGNGGSQKEFIDNFCNELSRHFPKYAQMCWDFCYVMQEGDIVIWRKTEDQECKTISGWGIVTSEYIYDPENPIYDFDSFRQIEWMSTKEFHLSTPKGLPHNTLSNVTYAAKKDARYLEILEEYGISMK